MKYPKGIKQTKTNYTTYKNRGMNLEKDLNDTNQYYANNSIAYIYKKPTPIQITKVEFPNKYSAIIKEAFFKEPSTTDYNGLYKGKYIDFEAKETHNKTSFPLTNIHQHQIKHIENIWKNYGIVFLIVRFTTTNDTYLLLGEDFINFINNNDRKSIPLSYFKEKAYLLKDKYQPRIDYLEVISDIYGGINE